MLSEECDEVKTLRKTSFACAPARRKFENSIHLVTF